uniref:Membrane magnesium transporter n=1 Tax=Caenorhabditis tropicalis TaxID=1561998 RepID=A0A1I7T9B9_9PELO
MASTIYRLITIVSLLSLIHCAYSAAQHRFYLRLTEQPFVSLPADVVAQTVISLVALIYGTSYLANPFQYIKKDQHHDRTCDEALNCPSFITFENRSKAMSPEFAMLRTLKQQQRQRQTSSRKETHSGRVSETIHSSESTDSQE